MVRARQVLLRIAAAALAAFVWAGAARADLQVCNMGGKAQSVAIAYDEGEPYTSEGWWVVAPGKCTTVISGDLTHRFIFWRANAKGRTFDGDTYFFCTTPEVFTLKDAGGDCAAQGAKLDEFRRIDIGTNKSWRLDVDAPPVQAPAFVPGSLGQAFAAEGLAQECGHIDGAAYCDVFVRGQQYRAYEGKGTPGAVMRYLRDQPALTPLRISADILSATGTETQVAISSVVPTAPDALQNVRQALQGSWESEIKDLIPVYDVMGSVDTMVMDGFDIGNLAVLPECPGGPASVGPVLLRQSANSEPTDEYPVTAPQCFQIASLSKDRMELRDVESGEVFAFVRIPY